MPTHPFAIKCADALENLKRVRDGLRAAQAAADDTDKPAKKPRKKPTLLTGDVIDLSAYGIGNNSSITPGGATKLYDVTPTPAMAKLRQQLATAQRKCQERRATGHVAGHWQNTQDGRIWVRGGPGAPTNAPCPEVGRIQDQIMRLMRQGNAFIVKRRAS